MFVEQKKMIILVLVLVVVLVLAGVGYRLLAPQADLSGMLGGVQGPCGRKKGKIGGVHFQANTLHYFLCSFNFCIFCVWQKSRAKGEMV